MSPLALGLVLFAALLHASWNAMVKAAPDRAASLAGIAAAHVIAGLALTAISPPPAPESWPSLLASTVVHYGYYVLIFHSYRVGDLSQAYPVARGVAPALVAVSTFLIIGENLSPLGWVGVAAVSAGIGLLAFLGGRAGSRQALAYALLLGLCIAAYSVADGIGVRRAGDPNAYIGWLFLLEAPVVLFIAGNRARVRAPLGLRTAAVGLIGGFLSVAAYGIVLHVKTFAPIGAVSAVRESSVVIAALLGVILFHERPWKGRLFAAVIVACGVMALAAAP